MSDLWMPPESRHAVWVPDAEQIIVVGWRPGPAGVSSIDLTPTLRLTVDHAAPTTLAEIVIEAPGGRLDPLDARISAAVLGDDAASQLMTLAKVGRDRPVRLADPFDRYDDPRRRTPLARLALASDLGDDEDLPPLVRGYARLEAGRVAADLETTLGRALARRLLLDATTDLTQGVDALARDRVRGDLAVYAHDVRGHAAVLRGFLDLGDEYPEGWSRVLATADRLLSELHDDGTTGLATQHARITPFDEPAVSFAASPPRPAAAAAPAVGRTARQEREVTPDDAVEVDATTGSRALAWIDSGGNVQITAPRTLERQWARVFRRRGDLLLGLSPLLPATSTAGVEATVLIPSGHAADDLLVDVTDEPAAPRPSAALVELRNAVRAGRTAAHHTRTRSPSAGDHWRRTAGAWRSLGDTTRANVAERYASARVTRTRSGDLRDAIFEAATADRVWDMVDI